MPNYKKLYHKTFNAMTHADKLISQASSIIQTAQQECEDIYVEAEDAQISLLETVDGKEPEDDGK